MLETSKPRIIKFELEHIAKINGRDGDMPERIERGMELLKTRPYMAFSGQIEDRLLGAAGIVNLGGGDGYAWVYVSPEIENYKIWFHRNIKLYMRAIIRTYRLSRIQADTLAYVQRNCEWLEKLGYKVKPYMHYELEIEK